MPANDHSRCVRFGPFEADLAAHQLRKHGQRVRVSYQPFEVLSLLIARQGHVVTRDELHARLWPQNSVGDFDHGLNVAVKKLRDALADNADQPTYIETIPRVGYRFIADVADLEPEDGSPDSRVAALGARERAGASREQDKAGSWIRATLWWARPSLAAALLSGAGFLLYLFRPLSPLPTIQEIVRLTESGHVARSQYLLTDGPRVYFLGYANGRTQIASVPSAGGRVALLSSPFKTFDIQDIAPSGAELLIQNYGDSEADLWSLALPDGSPRQIHKQLTGGAAYSPDGKWIVSAIGVGSELYVMKADGSEPRLLLRLSGVGLSVIAARWSPRGDLIRFAVHDSRADTVTLWDATLSGDSHPMLAEGVEPAQQGSGDWTPDGRCFVFSSRSRGRRDLWVVEDHADFLHRRRTDPIRLTQGPVTFVRPIVSRDGKSILAIGYQPSGELVRYDSPTGHFVPYLGGISVDHVEFSPDGKWVTYIAFPEGSLWRSKSDGTERMQLTFAPMRALAPRWSPDGARIVFAGSTNETASHLYITPRDVADAARVLDEPGTEGSASWAPNGRELVYDHFDPAGPEDSLRIYDSAARTSRKIADSERLVGPMWSPDGRYIAALTNESGEARLFDTGSGKWTDLHIRGSYPNWSRDGAHLYLNGGDYVDPHVYRIHVPDLKIERVADLTGVAPAGLWGTWSGLAPDGSVLLLRDLSAENIYAIQWRH